MSFIPFVTRRYLFAKRGQAFISAASLISIIGVVLGVASLIVVMGVMNGFTTDLRDKIIGVTAHGIIFNSRTNAMDEPEVLQKIGNVQGVTGATPFIYSELMLSTSSGVKGIALRGIDPATAPKVLGALTKMTEGTIDDLSSDEGLPGIIVGKDLARKLGLFTGSRVNLLAPSGQAGSAGYTPRIRPFRVVGIFSIGLYEYDSSMAFVSLGAAREVMGWPDKFLTGYEIGVTDVYKADKIADEVVRTLGADFYYETWMTMNSQLFAALKLEKTAMAIILGLLILVGSFSIVTALVMLVMEKTKDIAILMSMGATSGAIRAIFMLQGVIIGIIGTVIGFALGLSVCFLLEKYQFVELPKGVYSLDYLPVLLETPDLILTAACAIFLCFLATLYPSSQAANLEPVEAMRHE